MIEKKLGGAGTVILSKEHVIKKLSRKTAIYKEAIVAYL